MSPRNGTLLHHSVLAFIVCACCAAPRILFAAQADLSWDPAPEMDVVGYQVYYGMESGSYTEVVDAGYLTTLNITGLIEGQVYHFAVSAYDASGNEGALSDEVSFAAAVKGVTPPLFMDMFDGTNQGDSEWDLVAGGWMVNAAGKLVSREQHVNLALVAAESLPELTNGSIETDATLTTDPQASATVVFAYVDRGHYRYVTIKKSGIIIGQVGASATEAQGVKSVRRRAVSSNRPHHLRIDFAADGAVTVFIDGRTTPAVEHLFTDEISGRVGCRARGTRVAFDNFSVWGEGAR